MNWTMKDKNVFLAMTSQKVSRCKDEMEVMFLKMKKILHQLRKTLKMFK